MSSRLASKTDSGLTPPSDGLVSFSTDGFRGEISAPYACGEFVSALQTLIDPKSAIKSLHWGRNYLYVSSFPGPQGRVKVVVKQFRNAGLKRRLRRRWRGSKAERSFRVARAMEQARLLTPEPLVLIDSTQLDGPSFYVCRYLENALEARYLLRAMNAGRESELFPHMDPKEFLSTLGSFLRRLHDLEFWHRDISTGNILIGGGAGASGASGPAPMELYLIDLNRTRMGRPVTTNERLRDLCRMPIFRPEHRRVFLASYWGTRTRFARLKQAGYLVYHHAFLWKNRSKQGWRGGQRRVADLLLPRRRPHAHIEPPTPEASRRDKVVWDPLSDQPHQHAGRLEKLAVRLADSSSHLRDGTIVLAALPRIWRRYRQLKAALYESSVSWEGMGVCVRPHRQDPEGLLDALDELGIKQVLLRVHPWEDLAEEEDLARELHSRGLELTFALPQNRELVRDPARWQQSVTDVAHRFLPYGRRFQIGQAINRSKWGIWKYGEYVELLTAATEILRRENPDVEILGPAVIDFEFHVTALVLNHPRDFSFDALSSLLYVDRRGAPENRQGGFDTVDKVVLLKAMAETSRNSSGRSWITEVNWPLREGPHSPAGRDVAVDEETQASYLVRYYLLTLGTGLVERVYWWQLIAKGYGLLDPGENGRLRRRPSFRALAGLREQLQGGVFLGPVPARPHTHLYRFRRKDGQELIVGWSTQKGGIEVALPGSCEAVFNRDGQSLSPPGPGKVHLDGAPSYFLLTGSSADSE